MKGKVVCILSDVRSGSTLFVQLLGAHSKIVSVGEVQWLRAYVLNDRRLYNPPHELLCACGSTFSECDFWQQTARVIDRPLEALRMIPRCLGWIEPGSRPNLLRRAPRRIVHLYPQLYRSRLVQRLYGGKRLAKDSMKLFQAIFSHTNARYVVDTSKTIYRFRSFYEWNQDEVSAIVLHRDYRAVIHSKMKRGISLQESAHGWASKVHQINTLAADLPPERMIQLKYEDLCAAPTDQLTRVCGFLGLEFEEGMLKRPDRDIHDLGGSPSKFQPTRRDIRFDDEYLRSFSGEQLQEMRRLVGAAAALAGYD